MSHLLSNARRVIGSSGRYGLAVASVSAAFSTAILLRHYRLPHPFTAFSLAAIAVTFWYAGTGPGILALVLASLGINHFFVPDLFAIGGPGRASYIFIYLVFGVLVSWFSNSRRRAERLLTEARDNLEVRVAERTSELSRTNDRLRNTQVELRGEKDRLALLLELTNNVVSNLETHDLLKSVTTTVRQVTRSDFAALGVPDSDPAQLGVYAVDLPTGPSGTVSGPGIPSLGTLAADRVWAGRIEDLLKNQEERDAFLGMQIRSQCALPIVSRGRALGFLVLGRRGAEPYPPGEIQFLEQVCQQIAIAMENALAYREISELKDKLALEKLYLEDEIRTEASFEEIIGQSRVLRRVLKDVETVAPTDSTVLIYGETGTGKELIARAIHNLSPRSAKTFVKLNCAAIPTGLLESELFGHEKGAFTSAVAQRIGRMELANHGTLFLDEIGEIPLELQPKLLRALQEREFERLGSTRTLRSDVRLIAATNRDLVAMVDEQKFRSDLFFRLNVFPIRIPALREREEDIPLLVRHFSQEYARRMNRSIENISSETMKALCRYSWPGNVRELQNVIERAVILSDSTTLNVPVAELTDPPNALPPASERMASYTRRTPVRDILTGVDRDEIMQALKQAGGRVGGPDGAASRLGLKRTTLITRMKKLGIVPKRALQPAQLGNHTAETSEPPVADLSSEI
jgi:formate hydrogenlyase transcriptional activator